MPTVFHYMQQPPYWIVQDEEGYWLVPARHGGWSERTPFVGHVMNLVPVADFGGIRLADDGLSPDFQ